MPLNDETRSLFVGFCILVSLAIVGSSVMHLSGVNDGEITRLLITLVGFALVLAGQWRSSSQVKATVLSGTAEASATASEVKAALDNSAKAVALKDAREAIERTTRHSVRNLAQQIVGSNDVVSRGLDEIRATTQCTYGLVNGVNAARIIAFASVARRLAEITNSHYDRLVADGAEAALREYESALREQEAARNLANPAPAEPDPPTVG